MNSSIEKIFRDNDNSLYIFSFPILSIKIIEITSTSNNYEDKVH